MAARIAGAPDPDPLRIDRLDRFQIAQHAPPIGDLPPRIDVAARLAPAQPEAAVIMDDHNEPCLCETLGKGPQSAVLEAGETVRHADRGMLARPTRLRQPGVQADGFSIAVDRDHQFVEHEAVP
jgi:hypothetical protein